jgi:hypothetical protein
MFPDRYPHRTWSLHLMKPYRLIFAASITILASGCFYSSQPVNSPLGTNCKSQTMGLMFLSRPDVTCEQSAQPPAPDAAPGTVKPTPAQ